ncbi:hypothetical protein [Natrialba sp. SSL1]|uniref:hypothetical protein n=1 Tax=Natrialba sp. SSL1 TaxID=1869245 RepID=UPI001113E752|nr:hypothetical protein [Natrialba sp. SSL1]
METHESTDDHPEYSNEDVAKVLSALIFIYGVSLIWSASTILDILLITLAFFSSLGILALSSWGLLTALTFFTGLLVKHTASIADQPTDGDLPIIALSLVMILILIGLRKDFLSDQ